MDAPIPNSGNPHPHPLPLVQEALEPYIHSRQSALRIRQTLSQAFEARLQDSRLSPASEDDAPLTNLSLACPVPVEGADDGGLAQAGAGEFSGLRKRYLDALAAHRAARRRYERLSDEVGEMGAAAAATATVSGSGAGPSMKGDELTTTTQTQTQPYITTLHLRRRRARLTALHNALERLASQRANPTAVDLKALVKRRVGEAPGQPSSTSGSGTGAGEDGAVGDAVFRLKKDLLCAKRSLDAEKGGRAAVGRELAEAEAEAEEDGDEGLGLRAQVYALGRARDELIGWVEGELGKLGEGGGGEDEEDEEAAQAAAGYEEDTESSYQDQVAALYDRYLESRAFLVSAVAAAAAAASTANTSTTSTSSTSTNAPPASLAKKTKQTTVSVPPSTTHTPIQTLLSHHQTSRALLARTTYLSHRLATATAHNNQLVQRLASESLMVAHGHGETRVRAWAEAAAVAGVETDGVVGEAVGRGEGALGGVAGVVGELVGRRAAFEDLVG